MASTTRLTLLLLLLGLALCAAALNVWAPWKAARSTATSSATLVGYQTRLQNCTAMRNRQFMEMFGQIPMLGESQLALSDASISLRKQVVTAASRWALENCYLPCAFEMCAWLLKDEAGDIVVWIQPTTLDSAITPEARLVFSPEALTLLDVNRVHHPCADFAREINWVRESCTNWYKM